LGRRARLKEGTDVSIITYGALVHRTEVAAAQLEREGIPSKSSICAPSLPMMGSHCRHRSQDAPRHVAYEDMLSWGYGAEIAARIADELFEELDAPVKRVAAMDTFCAYQPSSRT